MGWGGNNGFQMWLCEHVVSNSRYDALQECVASHTGMIMI